MYNRVNGVESSTDALISQVVAQTTPHSGKCLKNNVHRSLAVTRPALPAIQ